MTGQPILIGQKSSNCDALTQLLSIIVKQRHLADIAINIDQQRHLADIFSISLGEISQQSHLAAVANLNTSMEVYNFLICRIIFAQ